MSSQDKVRVRLLQLWCRSPQAPLVKASTAVKDIPLDHSTVDLSGEVSTRSNGNHAYEQLKFGLGEGEVLTNRGPRSETSLTPRSFIHVSISP